MQSIIEDYLAENKLSRRKLAYLEQEFERLMDSITEVCFLNIAGGLYCSELEIPQGSYWCQCIAAALDFLKPDRDEAGFDRLTRLNNELVLCGHIDPEDADAFER